MRVKVEEDERGETAGGVRTREEENNEMLLVQSKRSISVACFTLKERAERVS